MENRKSLLPIAAAVLAFPFAVLLGSMALYWFYDNARVDTGVNDVTMNAVSVILGILGFIGSAAMMICIPLAVLLVIIEFIRMLRGPRADLTA